MGLWRSRSNRPSGRHDAGGQTWSLAIVARWISFFAAVSAVAASSASAGQGPAAVAVSPEVHTDDWILTTLGSHSVLTGNRRDWNEGSLELLRRLRRDLIFGGRTDIRQRSNDTDVLYTALLSFTPIRTLEAHGAVTLVPAAHFSAEQIYAAGLEWRAVPQISLLSDYERLNFAAGPIDEFKAGATVWFTEVTSLTGRYVYGHSFGERSAFDAYAFRLNLGWSESGRVSLGFAHGVDPEKDPGIPGLIRTEADTFSAYWQVPLRRWLRLIAGAEFEDRKSIYSRTTGSAGFSARF
jgi:YaiO family outer membrane protein